MPLLDDCREYFDTDSLYDVLGLDSRTASTSEIKKAYYKQSMKWHPDKANSDDAEVTRLATVKFQLLSKVYNILSDKDKRALYDSSGVVDDENVLSDTDSYNLWRQVFKKVTKKDIEDFCLKYKDSDEEREDIAKVYEKCEGDMAKIMMHVMGTNFEDEERIKGIIISLIDEGKLKKNKKFTDSTSAAKTTARKKKAAKEAKEAEEMLKEIEKKEGTSDLAALILKRQADRSSIFDDIAAKYAKPKKGKK